METYEAQSSSAISSKQGISRVENDSPLSGSAALRFVAVIVMIACGIFTIAFLAGLELPDLAGMATSGY